MKNLATYGVSLALLMGATACDRGRSSSVAVLPRASFETRDEVPVGVSVSDALLVDLNRDGVLDLAVVSAADNQLEVLVGQGNGLFSSWATMPVSGSPSRIVSADLDGDSSEDLLILRPADELVSVLLNNGNAGFTARPPVVACPNAIDLGVGELTGDGELDIAVIHTDRPDVLVNTGFGGGYFGSPFFADLGPADASPTCLEIAEVNGDPREDLLVAERQRGQLMVFEVLDGTGLQAPEAFSVGSFPVDIAVGDLNSDARPDIAVANFGGLDVSLLTRAVNTFAADSLSLAEPPRGLDVADLDGDGINDLAVSLFDRGSVGVFRGRVDGAFREELRLDATALPFRPLSGDVDMDGRTDLVVAALGQDVLDLFRGRTGRLNGGHNHDVTLNRPDHAVAFDLDGDGDRELALVGGGSQLITIADFVPASAPDLTAVTPAVVVGMGRPVSDVARGDFDADGRDDLAVATDRGIKLLVNESTAGSSLLTGFPAAPNDVLAGGFGPFDVEVADMNADGIDDIVFADNGASLVTVLVAQDTAFAYDVFSFPMPAAIGPGALAVADFTADGLVDVAVAREDAAVSILANDGDGRLTPLFDLPLSSGFHRLVTADFDADGHADLVVSDGFSDDVLVLLMTNSGVVEVTHPAAPAARAVAADDVNADGHVDIVVTSLTDAEFLVLYGDGGGGFPVRTRFPGPLTATSGVAIDATGNGSVDLVFPGPGTSRLSIYQAQ